MCFECRSSLYLVLKKNMEGQVGSDDEVPQLSAEAAQALQEFISEQNERERKAKEILEFQGTKELSDVSFSEDWQLSQFWYDNDTTNTLAKAAVIAAGEGGKIALISCPTLYMAIKQLDATIEVTLLEFDTRFAVYGTDFIFYDYKSPLDVSRDLASSFDIVILDPPFLSEECLTKSAVTAKFLSKEKVILCTGSVMEDLAKRLLSVHKCQFVPHHQNNLANEFYCFSNYDFDKSLQTKNCK